MTATGSELRERGITAVLAVDAAAQPSYGDLVRQAIDQQTGTFTAEDIRAAVTQIDPSAVAHHPNVLPAVFGSLASQNRIVCVGVQRTTRRSRHAARNLVWRRA